MVLGGEERLECEIRVDWERLGPQVSELEYFGFVLDE